MLGSLDTGHQELPCGVSALGDPGDSLEAFAGYYDIMQSIFSPAVRRDTLLTKPRDLSPRR